MKFKAAFILLFVTLISCQDEEITSSDNFLKIYDSQQSNIKYDPVDLVETENGYLILAREGTTAIDDNTSSFPRVQLLEIDQEGNYVSTNSLGEDHVLPTGNFITIEDRHYFVTMDPTSISSQLISIGSSIEDMQTIPLSGGIQYPLAINVTSEGDILVLSHSLDDDITILSRHDTEGSLLSSTSYSIGPGNSVTADVLDHFIDPEISGLPFFCGEVSPNTYYFNGFYDYSFSLVFTDLNSRPLGTIQGQETHGGITAIMPIQGNNYALFGFQFNDNFYQPLQDLNINGTASSIDYFTLPASEFIARSNAKFIPYTKGDSTYTLMAAETQTREISLNFYDQQNANDRGVHHIGHINPFNLSSIKVDADNNLLILGSTLVSGRFQRIFVNKIDYRKVEDMIK